MDQRFLTPTELATLLRLRPSTIKCWAREGRIPCLRFSKGVLRFDVDAVRRAIAVEAGHTPADQDDSGSGRGTDSRRPS
jgi:predicted site-specific integrase-resolvase